MTGNDAQFVVTIVVLFSFICEPSGVFHCAPCTADFLMCSVVLFLLPRPAASAVATMGIFYCYLEYYHKRSQMTSLSGMAVMSQLCFIDTW